MKKILSTVLCAVVIAAICVTMAACSGDSFYQLERALRNINDTSDSMDEVANEDLQPITSSFSIESDIVMLSNEIAVAEDEMTKTEKVSAILTLHDEIKAYTETIKSGKEELMASIQEIKDIVKNLKAQGYKLTEEDRASLKTYIDELKEINETLKGTIGKAYKRMYDLRGHYNLANADTIYTTFTEVKEVLNTRIQKLDRLNEIADELILKFGAEVTAETTEG